jgi:hypothetical protein
VIVAIRGAGDTGRFGAERLGAAGLEVPRAELARGSGHEIDYATVARRLAASSRSPVAGSK